MAQREDSRHRYTYAEYLAYERDSELKHDFVDGEILAVAGGSLRHGALASRLSAALEANRAPGCVAFSSDVKVRVLATGRAYYSDASMVRGLIETDPEDSAGRTITNPTLLVEVLSPTTEAVDRGAKWLDYQQLTSLGEIRPRQPERASHRALSAPAIGSLGVRRDRSGDADSR